MNKEHSLEEDARHGTKEQPIAVMEFRAGEGTYYPEGFFVERHWHRGIEILKVREGSYTVEVNLEDLLLEKGEICVINSEELHQIRGNARTSRHEVIIFQPEILGFRYEDAFQKRLVEPLVSMQDSFVHRIRREDAGYAEIDRLFSQVTEAGKRQEEDWYFDAKLEMLRMVRSLKKCGFTQPTRSTLGAAEKEKTDRYKRIVSYMEEHYMEKVTLEDLAETAQCNPQYLCHFFKEIAGVPPMQYLIGYRIERAKEELAHSTKTVLEISLDCGFENVSYFIRQFKKATGMTPGKCRQERPRM